MAHVNEKNLGDGSKGSQKVEHGDQALAIQNCDEGMSPLMTRFQASGKKQQ